MGHGLQARALTPRPYRRQCIGRLRLRLAGTGDDPTTRKEKWIGTHQGSAYTQVTLENLETDVRVYGDAAIRWDVQHSVCLYHGETIEGLFNVIGVWIRGDDRWHLTYCCTPPVCPDQTNRKCAHR